MRIVIDMQGAQTESRYRGIGRYTMSFAQAIARNRGKHEIILVLNGLFPGAIEPIRTAFEGLLPQENIRVWYAPGPVKKVQPGNATRHEIAELMREAFIASLNPDIVHITSLFEGFVDDAVTSIGRFDASTPVSVTLYDLIPLLNPKQYLQPNPDYKTYYQRKVKWLENASLMLAISNYTKQEAIQALGGKENKIVSISTAIEENFQKLDISSEKAKNFLGRLGIILPFVLYTGGADERKNLARLIQAYAKLKPELRKQHQLVFAGRMPEGETNRLKAVAAKNGLKSNELIFSGYVSEEELITLYNLCKLYVFPSWHEGFGLPALEAMACGVPVIGANTTSLPEVIGLEDALFDPFNVSSITEKIQQTLTNENFRKKLIEHAAHQVKKFSWDKTALRAFAAWEALNAKQISQDRLQKPIKIKPRLAFVSPLPPERTGIADYSAELLPVLAKYYNIELIVDQKHVDSEFLGKNDFKVRDASWLRSNIKDVDRVLYHVGNSPFHKHILTLLKEIPGTVVLHDFYSSGLMAWLEHLGGEANAWSYELYKSHGYGAVCDRHNDLEEAKRKYPANWHILHQAQGVIVHSEYSRSLAIQWYGEHVPADWKVIPLLRSPKHKNERHTARQNLNIGTNDFVICSLGFLDPTKLNHRLLKSWLSSSLANEKHCHLIFVGENHGGDYGEHLLQAIHESGLADKIRITGFVTAGEFHQYLAAADIAVQLRTESRGETSAAVLDCMNHGLPLITNANGSLAELDADSVWLLPDEFSDDALIEAIEVLWRDQERRELLGKRAQEIIRKNHAPEQCATQYAAAIEHFQRSSQTELPALINRITSDYILNDSELINLADAIDKNLPLPQPAKRLFLDITATCSNDLKTGIERVARALMIELIKSPPNGYRVEPVYLSNLNGQWRYIYARQYTSKLLNIPKGILQDEIADMASGDIVLGLDLSGSTFSESVETGYIGHLRNHGVSVYFTLFDLLPVRMPEAFPPGADAGHKRWLKAIASTDGVIGISKTVAEDFSKWIVETSCQEGQQREFKIEYFHLGADIESSAPSRGTPPNAESVLADILDRPSFLMVGTIEPRKAYAYTLSAFENLWAEGFDINLVIVGKEGWIGLPDDTRRDIPETVQRIKEHPENGKRLFWLEDISDEFLNEVYSNSNCLIAASYGEGFGLPLIEAAQKKIPIIARDIPVFREVAGDHAFYFSSEKPEDLAKAIQQWIKLYKQGDHPTSDNLPWLTWKESAQNLMEIMIGRKSGLDEERAQL